MVVGFICCVSNPKSFLSRLHHQQRFAGAGCIGGLLAHEGLRKGKIERLLAKASQSQPLDFQILGACKSGYFGSHNVSLRLRLKVSTNIDGILSKSG
jgi:hypothetical protein